MSLAIPSYARAWTEYFKKINDLIESVLMSVILIILVTGTVLIMVSDIVVGVFEWAKNMPTADHPYIMGIFFEFCLEAIPLVIAMWVAFKGYRNVWEAFTTIGRAAQFVILVSIVLAFADALKDAAGAYHYLENGTFWMRWLGIFAMFSASLLGETAAPLVPRFIRYIIAALEFEFKGITDSRGIEGQMVEKLKAKIEELRLSDEVVELTEVSAYAYHLNGHEFCKLTAQGITLRVGGKIYTAVLNKKIKVGDAVEMDGVKEFVRLGMEIYQDDKALTSWINQAIKYTKSLPVADPIELDLNVVDV
jgi:hypothetical protein